MEHALDPPEPTLPVRLRLIIVLIPILAAVTAGGCATLGRPMVEPTSALGQALPAPVTVRAQSDDLPTGAIPAVAAAAPAPNLPLTEQPGDQATAAPGPATTGLIDTALESLFGEALTSEWAPLSLATLFTEGWNQPFKFSPASDSGALRQEWINAANGVFYRQWVLDYNFRDHVTPSGNRDIGTWSIFAPLSRRLELYIAVPFVDYHALDRAPAASGGRGNPSPAAASARAPYQSTFGDMVITPQVLLSETRNTSIMSLLALRTPTGSLSAGDGDTSIGPQLQFWHGLPNRWVVRGGAGPTIPLSATGLHASFDSNLTVGRFLTLDDVRFFKELTVWVAATNSAALDHSGPAADTLTILPGVRFRFAQKTWFLFGIEIPLVAPRNEDYGVYVRLVRRW